MGVGERVDEHDQGLRRAVGELTRDPADVFIFWDEISPQAQFLKHTAIDDEFV